MKKNGRIKKRANFHLRMQIFCLKGTCIPCNQQPEVCLYANTYNAWFTFSWRQHETRQERECEGYIRLLFHTLDLFSSHLESLRDMSINQSRVKGNKNAPNVLPLYRRFSQESVNVYIHAYFVFVHISPTVSTSTRNKNVNHNTFTKFMIYLVFFFVRIFWKWSGARHLNAFL